MNHYALTERTAMIAHWLGLVPEWLWLRAGEGRWDATCDRLEDRCGFFGMGRN